MLTEDWREADRFVLYGFGAIAHDNLSLFKKEFNIICIADSDKAKCGITYEGVAVRHINEALDDIRANKTVILTGNRNAKEIGQMLSEYGLLAERDFCSFEQFMTEWFWRFRRKAYIMEIHTSVTTRCSLRCRHCNMFMPYYKEQMDLSVDDVMENLDLLFKNADYVGGYKLLGGEPLINRELPDMLTAIYEKYGDRIGTLGIITNGTITPDDRLLEAAKRCGVTIDISDYTGAVDYDGHLDKTIAAVRDAGIKYRVNRSLRWCDFGFPAANRQYGFDEVNGHMLSCGPIFHGLNDGRFYYCHVSWSADKAGLLHNAVDDYIDLKELDGSDEAKERLLSHSRGEIEKGFVKLCKLCGGCGADNTEIIEVAEQCE